MKLKRNINSLIVMAIFFLLLNLSYGQGVIQGEKNSDGSIKKWHRIELVLEGPNREESPDTFRNFRLDVTFTSPTNEIYTVPGFFDGDEDPANTSATSGNTWKARFTAGEEGTWNYSVSFVTGTDVAANLTGGTSGTAPDGQTGSFEVGSQDKSGKDFRAKGKLEYVEEHYLQFANGENFVKVGANSPEVFLADIDFDGNVGNVDHSSQVSNFNQGDPTWGDNEGRGIIGVVNYLSDRNVNSHYFLSMNIFGDGRRSFPFIDDDSPYTYDVSKLAQWEIVFSQFDKMGLMLHFQTQETENMQFFEDLEGGVTQTEFSVARRIYYRELVARFGHHLAITWNIGEENNANFNSSQDQNTLEQRKLFADRVSDLTAYNDMITIHNGGAGQNNALRLYDDLLGDTSYTGTSLQLFFDNDDHDNVRFWYDQSVASGRKWVISYDEAFDGNNTRDLPTLRKGVIWSTLMAGGQFEWYHGGGDLNTNLDYTDFEDQWTTMGIAANFMNSNLSKDIHRMTPNDDLITNSNYAMAELGNVYLFYLVAGGNAIVNLSDGAGNEYSVQWFNPRNGETIDAAIVSGGSATTNLGSPPSETSEDWVVLLRRTDTEDTNLPPVVSFVTPDSGTNFIAPASLQVDVLANDTDGSIASVDLFINDALVRRERLDPYNWNNNNQDDLLSNLPAGSYTLRAVATDNDNATSTEELIFTVGIPNLPPVVSFITPDSGTNFTAPASVQVDVSASDTDGTINSVDLFINDVFVRQERVDPYNWNNNNQDNLLSDLTVGSYTIRAVATDNEGATTTTESVFTVGSINLNAPQIEFTLPLNNATVEGNIIVQVANTNTSIDVNNIVLFLDGVLLRQENVFPYVWNSRNGGSLDPELNTLSPGTHELRAVATSTDGIIGETTIVINVIENEELKINETIVLTSYPNPFTNTLTVTGFNNTDEVYSATLTSMNGSVLKVPITMNENDIEFSTINLANGMYLVTINTDKGKFIDTVVKQ